VRTLCVNCSAARTASPYTARCTPDQVVLHEHSSKTVWDHLLLMFCFNRFPYVITPAFSTPAFSTSAFSAPPIGGRMVQIWPQSPVVQLFSGKLICVRVWRRTEDSLNTYYDYWLMNDNTASYNWSERMSELSRKLVFWRVSENYNKIWSLH